MPWADGGINDSAHVDANTIVCTWATVRVFRRGVTDRVVARALPLGCFGLSCKLFVLAPAQRV